MQILLSLISAIAMSLASIAFQIGLATGHFKSYEWAMWPLFAASAFLWLIWIMLAIRHSRQRLQNSETPPPPPPPPFQHNEQRVEANPKQEQHLHLGSDFLEQLGKDRKSEPPPKPEQVRPNLVIGGMYSPQLHLLGDEFCVNPMDGLRHLPQVRSIVVEIMNASKENEPVGSAQDVKAELILYSQNRREIFGPLAWTETTCHTVDIGLGDHQHVILAVDLPRVDRNVDDWRVPINDRALSSYLPGAKKVSYRDLEKRDDVDMRLNILHVKSGTIVRSFRGKYRWAMDQPRPEFIFD